MLLKIFFKETRQVEDQRSDRPKNPWQQVLWSDDMEYVEK